MRFRLTNFRRATADVSPTIQFVAIAAVAAFGLIGLNPPSVSTAIAARDEVARTHEVLWSFSRPQGQTVRSINFIDSRRGWFVAGLSSDDCVIMYTENGGDSWTDAGCPVDNQPEDVFFVNERTGWIVGDRGLILRTDDGGRGWGRQNSGSSATLTSVFAIDENHAWITTRGGGNVLRTTNGGVSWEREGTGAESGLFDAFFFDRDQGWAVGGNGRIVRSHNGGRNWGQQSTGTESAFASVDFVDLDHGLAVGQHIYTTTNGGTNWIRRPGPGKSLEFVAMVDREFAWAVGDEGTIVLTRDGGATWTREGDPDRWEGRGVTAVTATDRGHMWASATGGWIIRRIDTSIEPPRPTPLPVTSTPWPTITPVPPTSTPLPRTPTPTITPTPSVSWIDIADTGQPFLVPAYGEKLIEIAYGNMGPSEVMTATLEGGIVFPDGETTYSTTVFSSGGAGTVPLVLLPDTSADPAPAPGDDLVIVVTMGGVTERLQGKIAYRAMFPWILKNHPEWMLPRD